MRAWAMARMAGVLSASLRLSSYYNALRGSVLVVANSRNNSVYKLRSSARRHTHAPQPALNLRSRPGYRPYVASTDTVLAA